MDKKQLDIFNAVATMLSRPGPAYFNTTELKGNELKERNAKALTQEQTVLKFFIDTPPHNFTASQVTYALNKQGVDIIKDSVKRSISNLSSSKGDKIPHLEKTGNLIPGPFGSSNPEHLYKLIHKTI